MWLKNSAIPARTGSAEECFFLLLSQYVSNLLWTSELSLLYANCQITGNVRVDAKKTWQHRAKRRQNNPMPLSGPVDVDTIRCRNEAIEQEGIISVSLGPVGIKIKQLLEQKVFLYWLACDAMAIFIVILCHSYVLQRKKLCNYLLLVYVIFFLSETLLFFHYNLAPL